MRNLCAAFCAALCISVGMSNWAAAQDVTLTSRDGSVEINGTLLGFDGEFYRVDTIYGELTVDGSGVSCVGPGCPSLQDYVAEVVVSGSATMGAVLLPALVDGFARTNGWDVVKRESDESSEALFILRDGATEQDQARFTFRSRTSDEGFADLLANEADIVMSLREIRPQERDRAKDAGMGDLTGPHRSRVLALDALVPVVSPSNPVSGLSPTQLAAVLSGEISNWQDLGGVNAPISVHILSKKTGLAQAVQDQVLSVIGARLRADVVEHDTGTEAAKAVQRDPFALAIVSYSDVGTTKQLTLTGSCGFSLAATRQTIKTEDYPLTAPMFLYLPARRLPKVVRDFLVFTRGQAAQVMIRRAGFVDQAQEAIGVAVQGTRFANAIRQSGSEVTLEDLQRLVSTLYDLKRLSTTFRFETGSTRLDAQSRSNVQQLAQALELGRFDGRRLLFVGFSDGEGPAAGNQRIAMRRAETVRAAVQSAAETANMDRLALEVDAFGEAMPMACDDSAWGRQVNRRVEVWVD